MNLLLNDKKFGVSKFLSACPCSGGGGGGAKICTTPYIQKKWVPNGTPSVSRPADGQPDSSGCFKRYTDEPFDIEFDPEIGETVEDPVGGTETCSPDGPLPPCVCGNERTNYDSRIEPAQPQWDSGTDESKTFNVTFKNSYFTQTAGGGASGGGACGGSFGIDTITQSISVPGKTYTKKWDFIHETTKDCVL
jgi:hypothetical protein